MTQLDNQVKHSVEAMKRKLGSLKNKSLFVKQRTDDSYSAGLKIV